MATYTITGVIASTTGAAVPNILAVAYDKRVGGDLLLAQGNSDPNGVYTVSFPSEKLQGKARPDIEVRAVAPGAATGTVGAAPAVFVLGTSEIRYNAGTTETINVIINAGSVPVTSEYDRLTKDVQAFTNNIALKDLQENANNNHITLLSNKTGWDARAVAMAAQANKLSATTKIPAEHYYALFRAGLPADNEALSRVPSSALTDVLTKATKDKVIPSIDIAATVKAWDAQSNAFLLKNSATLGVSNLSTMLGLRLNTDQQTLFAQSYRESGGDATQLWANLKAKGVPPDTITKLQLDGKMGFLTFQNAPLVKKLYDTYKVNDPVDLVKSGLYKASEWKKVIGTDVPQGLTADNYSAGMANLVSLSYPSAVAAEMVRNNEVKLDANLPKDELYTFLNTTNQQNVLGVRPVKQWDTYKQLKPASQAAAKQVERMYQLSPSNESLTALSQQGLGSAYQIVQYTRDQFLKKYGGTFPSVTEANLTYTKAQEVYSGTTNVATTYMTYRTTPNVYVLTGKTEKTEGDIIAYPTMEGLFGNLDYCACDECKSIIGAAAYMVDLLHFIDLASVPHDLSNPLDILLKRRPDIQHMQLTCENTNTVIPYIDIVNEILEYYIVNGNLGGFTGHDIAEGTDPNDLLADPQFVISAAYDKTNNEVYPFTLPFDRPRAALGLYFKAWDATLEQALRIFGTELAARKERLGLNLKEYDIFTNIGLHKLPEYFGELSGITIDQLNAAIANAKEFTRRTDITDEDLVSILETKFINPGTVLVPLLDQLQIGMDSVQKYLDGGLSDGDLNNLLPATLDKTAFGGNVGQWLKTNQALIGKLILFTDLTPDADDCNFTTMELRYALPPDATKNKLDEIAYHKLHRFIRLWKKLGWSIGTTDAVITTLIPTASKDLTTGNIDGVFVTLLARLANFSRLTEALSLSEKKIPLLLPLWDGTVDLVARQTLCAQFFKMRIEDLLDLAHITGLDPLAADLETDAPAILQLLQIVVDLKAATLKVADLAYLLMNEDLANKLTPDAGTLLKQVKSVRDALTAVEKDNSVAPDNADLSFAKGKMSLVYDSGVVDILFALLTNSTIYSAPLTLPEEALPVKLTVDPLLGYDAFKKLLTYTGILTAAAQASLNAAADGLTLADMTDITVQGDLDTFKTNFKQAVQNIKTDGDADLAALAASYPELKAVYDTVMAQPTPELQTNALIRNILPALIDKLKTVALRQAIAAVTKADADVVTALTGDAGVVHSIADNTKAVLNDFLALETLVVFNGNQTYEGYLDPPASDDYILFVKAPANTTVTLTVNGVVAVNNALIGPSGEVASAVPVTIQAGQLAAFTLVIAGLPGGKSATLWWRTKGMAKTPVPDSALYLKSAAGNAVASLVRLLNAVDLQQLLKLTAPELAYFAAVNAETKGFLNSLPANGTIADPDLHALWTKVYLLVYFANLKKDTEQEENSWLQILQQPGVKTPQGKTLLLDMNGWQQADVDSVLGKFGKTWNDLSALSLVRRLVAAMQLVTDINFPAASVIGWSIDNPDNNLIDAIKTAVRARTDDAAWLDTMQSISDVMRNLQRDALIAYILHHLQPLPQVDTADKLFEYFLIDVQMDACMKTSRIVQATATIQLFIYRCLMNLEIEVAASSIKADQWEWMQRYRVWQANRKIFLYPENWLDPELRDGKSSFYTDLEGELMQADITQDLAETAYLNYLKKLDDVARLEITGMYLQENEQGNTNDDILHVFGRTNGHTRQYYYRRFEFGYWTPWEKVGLNIEGDHLYPVIWKSRLFLFWLNVVVKATDSKRNENLNDMAKEQWGTNALKNVEINMVWGEYYHGKWTSPKSSDLKNPVTIPNVPVFDASNILLYARKEQRDPKTSEHLIFYLVYIGSDGTDQGNSITFTSKNAPPIIGDISNSDDIWNAVVLFNYELYRKAFESGTPSTLDATLLQMPGKQLKMVIDQPQFADQPTVTEAILTKSGNLYDGFRVLPLRHQVENQYQAPFFYQDEQSVFLAQPTEVDTPPLWVYLGYYDIGVYVAPAYKLNIQQLVERPVIILPPKKGIPDPGQPVVNPGAWEQVITQANENYSVVLPSAGNFSYDQATFGIGGKLNSLQTALLNVNAINRKL